MTKTVRIILISALSACMAALVFYCVQFGKTPEEKLSETPHTETGDILQTSARLSSAAETAWQSGSAQHITLSDDGSTASAPGVRITENTVTVTTPGIYIVSGKLNEGRLAVDCDDTVTLILDNAEIKNSSDSAIYVSNAAHTQIYLPEGSTNKLVSGTECKITAASENADVESASGAALYARDNLSVAGCGKLTVCGYINNAVATTNHLAVLGGELELEAVNNGLKGKDSVTVSDGTINILCGNDGIKSSEGTDTDCGNIDICGGEINITSLGDGIQAEKNLSVTDGIITVTAGDITSVSSETPVHTGVNFADDMQSGIEPGGMNPQGGETPPEMPDGAGPGGMNPQGGETPPEMPDGAGPGGMNPQGGETPPEMPGDRADMYDRDQTSVSGSDASTKGLKCGEALTVSGGSITVNSVDDCIHADGSIIVNGGTFGLCTADDGFHADDTLTISGGSITVSESYEGLEGHYIYLSGGNISITASDDGINANGGFTGFGNISGDSSLPVLKISGGTLYVNAAGDGLDSNGDLIVEGGNIIVDGPSDGGNGALDSGSENGGSIVCNGGTVLAIGNSGMAESFSADSSQCSFIKNFGGTMPGGTQITITDESGKTVFEHKSAKSFNSVVFGSPELVLGKTYTVCANGQTEKVTIESISNGDISDGPGQGGFGGRGGR